jgi:hypothetical protein
MRKSNDHLSLRFASQLTEGKTSVAIWKCLERQRPSRSFGGYSVEKGQPANSLIAARWHSRSAHIKQGKESLCADPRKHEREFCYRFLQRSKHMNKSDRKKLTETASLKRSQ